MIRSLVCLLLVALVAPGCDSVTGFTDEGADLVGYVEAVDRTDEPVVSIRFGAIHNADSLPDALIHVTDETRIELRVGGDLVVIDESEIVAGDRAHVWHTDQEWLSIPPGYDATRILIER